MFSKYVKFSREGRPLNIHNDNALALTDFGLTLCQARVYLALVESGMLTAKAIAKISKISQPDVYRIVPTLQSLGLVEKIIAVPASFRALPIKNGLSLLLGNRINEINELQAKAETICNDIKKRPNQEEDFPMFSIIPPKKMVLSKYSEILNNAQESVCAIMSWKRYFHWDPVFIDIFERAYERGVITRLITDKSEESPPLKSVLDRLKKPIFEVKYFIHPVNAAIAICDKKEVILGTDIKSLRDRVPAFWSSNSDLVSALQHYFELLWIKALKVT